MNQSLIKCYLIYLLQVQLLKKFTYDDMEQRAVSKFVPADDLIVPYTATSLDDAEAIIHRVKISENDLRKQQVAGFYRDVELENLKTKKLMLRKKKENLKEFKNKRRRCIYIIRMSR